jgi:xanthine/CO dehydrogenase XdhC/CoxF family maturation factor
MKDDGLILTAWAEAQRQNSPAILATVVKVSGSAYRGPGARMLVSESGGRTGSISGGCLEGDLLKKAWWLTAENCAAIQVYDNTSEEEAIWEFGLGCNGIVHVLLERWNAASHPLTIELLAACRAARRSGVLATVIAGHHFGRKLAIFPDSTVRSEITSIRLQTEILKRAQLGEQTAESAVHCIEDSEVFIEYVEPPVSLLVVGAGHDAMPVVALAKELGWHVTVVDGRAHFARPERFPLADRVLAVPDLEDPLRNLSVDSRTAVVLMSHSYSQDAAFLQALAPLPLRYLGVLGPRQRTDRMLTAAGSPLPPNLHSPVGLDIGADAAEEIALAIVSEIQAALNGRPGGMLFRRPGPIHEARQQVSPAAEIARV